MTAATGGIDVLVFTGGVGEHSALVRRLATDRLAYLGVEVDPVRNADAVPDVDVSGLLATVRTVVVAAREDLQIAAGVRRSLRTTGGCGTLDPRHPFRTRDTEVTATPRRPMTIRVFLLDDHEVVRTGCASCSRAAATSRSWAKPVRPPPPGPHTGTDA